MSGGSMNYFSFSIQNYANDLCDKELTELALDLAEVFHEAEWWHSSDTCEADYRKAVEVFKNKWFGSDRCERLKGYVNEIFGRAKKECLSLLPKAGENDG